jgi:ABC-type multidrug transport system permease subunit
MPGMLQNFTTLQSVNIHPHVFYISLNDILLSLENFLYHQNWFIFSAMLITMTLSCFILFL